MNSLDDQLSVVKKYSNTSAEYTNAWNEVYDKRSTILKTFVDKYGLKVDSKYQDTLDDLVRNGNSVQEKNETDQVINNLVSSAQFDRTEAEYGGYYTYSAVIENTSKINFGNVSLLLALYDADGVKVEETFANTSSWAAGEKVRFEAGTDVNAAQVKVSVSNYEVGASFWRCAGWHESSVIRVVSAGHLLVFSCQRVDTVYECNVCSWCLMSGIGNIEGKRRLCLGVPERVL